MTQFKIYSILRHFRTTSQIHFLYEKANSAWNSTAVRGTVNKKQYLDIDVKGLKLKEVKC